MGKHESTTSKSAAKSNTNPAFALTPEQVALAITTSVENMAGIQGPMTAEQSRSFPRVPLAGLPLVLAEANAALQYPDAIPPTIDAVGMQASYARIQALRGVQAAILACQRRIDATIIKEEAAFWSDGLDLYSFFQRQQKKEPNLILVVEQMTAFLAKGPRVQKDKPGESSASPGASTTPAGNGSTASAGSSSNGSTPPYSTGGSSGSNGSSSASTANEPVTVYGPSGVVGTSAPTNVSNAGSNGNSGSGSRD